MIPLIAAFIGAVTVFGGNLIIEQLKRHRERCTVAGAIAGEISAYIDLIRPDQTPDNYRRIGQFSRDVRQLRLRALPHPPAMHPVFDKIGDRIGLLDVQDAAAISEIYNVISSVRLLIVNLSSESFCAAPDEVHIAFLNAIADAVENYSPKARTLVDRLKVVSAEGLGARAILRGRKAVLAVVVVGLAFCGLGWQLRTLTKENMRQEKEISALKAKLIVPQPSSAGELFHLRSECAAFAQKIEDDNFTGPALTRSHNSRYDTATGHCYVQTTTQSADLSLKYYTVALYDGQTKDMLAFATIKDGKKHVMVFGSHQASPGNDAGYTDSVDFMSGLMEEPTK